MAYLFDTHALIFWDSRKEASQKFLDFFHDDARGGELFISSVSIWEVALLAQKGRIDISLGSVIDWKNEMLATTSLQLLVPTEDEMVWSAQLPIHHKDPFDRLLIAQAVAHNLKLVTRDGLIQRYVVETFWL